MTTPVVVTLPHSRDTKGTHLFMDEGNPKIRNIYVQKGTWPNDKAPKRIKVTIESIDE